MKCQECRFYREGQDHGQGWCHRNAPSPLLGGMRSPGTIGPWSSVFWPEVANDDGCGDFVALKGTRSLVKR